MTTGDVHDDYPEFWGFLIAFSPECYDGDMPTDEEIIREENFGARYNLAMHRRIRQQASAILQMDPFPAHYVDAILNRYFESPAECKAWVERVVNMLDK